jgi:hypothetical protein
VTEPGNRDAYREQLLKSIGGVSGTIITAIPPIVFVVVNAIAGLRWAIGAAVGSAVLLAGYRVFRRQSIQQAANGLFAVIVAAVIAARTGQARGYFLVGIWASFAYAAVFAVSAVVRRPIVGVLWEYLDPTPLPDGVTWRHERTLLRAYDLATLCATAIFAARAVVQQALFNENRTGWLAVARIAMGYPLTIVAIGFGFWVVRRARKRLAPAAGDTVEVDDAG